MIYVINAGDVLCDLVPIAQYKKRENNHRGVIPLVKFTKSNTPPWVFFTFCKLNKWYKIAQSVSYIKTATKWKAFQ